MVLFQSDDENGYSINILDLRDQELLFTVKEGIPAGTYTKIRLGVKDIVPVAKEGITPACENMIIKLPSGKIDLNPRGGGGIEIIGGETLSVTLDFDANKSIDLHVAGNSGKCIFRPVIFVDIESPEETPDHCIQILEGTIDDIIYDDEQAVAGFILNLPGGRDPVNVYIIEEAAIFDENGLPIGTEELKTKSGQYAAVQGDLDFERKFQASLIVIGEVLTLKGTVTGAGIDEFMQFSIEVAPGQEFVAGPVTVTLSDKTPILIGCDEAVNPLSIEGGMQIRVTGKYDAEKNELLAMAVFINPDPDQMAGNSMQ